MTPFEFTLTIYGIVVALGLARLLGGLANMVRARIRSSHEMLIVLWMLLLLVTFIGWWFSQWDNSQVESFSFWSVLFTFHIPALMYVATHLLVPLESDSEEMVESYSRVRIPFLVCVSLPLFIAPSIAMILGGNYWLIYLPITSVLLLSAIPFANIRYQLFVASLSLVLYLTFISQFRSTVAA